MHNIDFLANAIGLGTTAKALPVQQADVCSTSDAQDKPTNVAAHLHNMNRFVVPVLEVIQQGPEPDATVMPAL